MSGLIVSLSPPYWNKSLDYHRALRKYPYTAMWEPIYWRRDNDKWNWKMGGKKEKLVATTDIYVMVPVLELYFHMHSNVVLYYSWLSHALQCTCRRMCVIPGLQNSTNSHINSYAHSLPVVVCLWMEQNKNRQQRRSCSGKTPHPNPPVSARSSHRNTIYLIQASVKHG